MASSDQIILTGSYSRSVSTLVFVPSPSPSLTVRSALEVGHHPSWLTRLPAVVEHDGTIVFAGLEQSTGAIVAIRFDRAGRGTELGSAPSGGRDPCTLEVTTGPGDGPPELIVGNVRPAPPRTCSEDCDLTVARCGVVALLVFFRHARDAAARACRAVPPAQHVRHIPARGHGPKLGTAGGGAPASCSLRWRRTTRARSWRGPDLALPAWHGRKVGGARER